MNFKLFFKQHAPLLALLLIYLIFASAYSVFIPLGEAPDESAQLAYARFIAKNGRLPTTLAERQEAGYRSTWPPLYHFIIAAPLLALGDAPPTRLKSVGDTPRRLIPTNGQTIAAFIHTADEAWPWQGITLAWHGGRFISVILSALAVWVTYVIVWRLSRQRLLASSAAAMQAFLPQFLFIGSIINDDNLLILFSELVLLALIIYTQRPVPPRFGHFLFLGALLGLATVSKYNALPLWGITYVWMVWLTCYKDYNQSPTLQPRFYAILSMLVIVIGAALTGGWWFIFVWYHFNQIETLGLVQGSFAALSAGTADASLRYIGQVKAVIVPPLGVWLEWVTLLFQSFWGLFGGGSTIPFSNWIYWLLAFISLVITIGLVRLYMPHFIRKGGKAPGVKVSIPFFYLLIPLFFLPLPLLRFILSNSIVETAQGRHIFPALPFIVLGLALGLSYFAHYTPPAINYARRITAYILPLILFILSLYSLNLIHSSYPPPIPLQTSKNINHQLSTNLAPGVTLLGYEMGELKAGVLPITLLWQADSIPTEDYLLELNLINSYDQPLGNWIGQPLSGRYPTRAWDKGDILQDIILLPILPGTVTTEASLNLTLLDTSQQPVSTPLTLTDYLLPAMDYPLPIFPAQLRTDKLPANAPFTYRNTLSFVLPNQTETPKLTAPDGQTFLPVKSISNSYGNIAHFMVDPNWPSGIYQTPTGGAFSIVNRHIQLDPPPMDYTLEANFADQITILGYDLPQRRVQAGQSFPLTLHLQAKQTLGQDLAIFNHLLDAHATQRGGVDRIPQQYYTTLLWVPGEVVSDNYEVPVDENVSDGVYWLDVGLYPTNNPAASLPLFVDGQPIDRRSVTIGPIKVGGPPPDVTIEVAQPQTALKHTFGNQITLLGFDLSHPTLRLGADPLALTLYWSPNTRPQTDYTIFVHIVDSSANLVAQVDSPPAAGTYPTTLWDPGEIIIDKRTLPDLLPGHYTVRLGLYRPDTGERLAVANSLDGAINLLQFTVE